ncbi:hypothetical protein ACFR9U_04585 [Halorientalis brevis]|uniref:ApeA N-terminal domain-containing protein n=1 Tax=Halorientalis brevis TaxID=1126241 RepID=A0ABD6C953_9EURY|nr:hypothetical protein [Halorientalis brevis]
MSNVGLICEAEVPEGSTIEIEVCEDIDSDGTVEQRDSILIETGEFLYILDGLTGKRDSRYSTDINFERDSVDVSPSVSSLSLLTPGYSENSQMDLRAIMDKHGQMNYFLHQLKNGDKSAFRYNLSGFLAGAISIEEILESKSDFGIESWAEESWIVDLNAYMRDNRNNAMHLGKPVDSGYRPGTGHSQSINFGSEEEQTNPSQRHLFLDVPGSIIEAIGEDLDDLTLADSCSAYADSPIAKSLPVVPLCQLYFEIFQERRIDWLRSKDDVDVHIVDRGKGEN